MSDVSDAEKILIVVNSDKTRAPVVKSALDIAIVATMYDAEVEMIFGVGTKDLLLKGVPETVKPTEEGDSLKEVIEMAKENDVKIFVCSPLLETYGYKREDFIDEVDDVVGGSYLVSKSLESDVVLSF